jgi:hypothetical protein
MRKLRTDYNRPAHLFLLLTTKTPIESCPSYPQNFHKLGSPSKFKARTFRASFCFPTDKKPQRSNPYPSSRRYRNLVILAKEWQEALGSREYSSRVDIARQQGISRARVTQVLQLLNLAPDVLNTIAALGDPLSFRTVTERVLRSLVHRSADEQRQEINSLLAKVTTEQNLQLNLSDLSSPNSIEGS